MGGGQEGVAVKALTLEGHKGLAPAQLAGVVGDAAQVGGPRNAMVDGTQQV